MKNFLLVLALIISAATMASAQFTVQKPSLKVQFQNYQKWRPAASFGFGFVGGVARGIREVLIIDYRAFKAKHPNSNDQFWNPKVSWTNKYADGDPNKGAKFPGARHLGVIVTDGYHLMPAIYMTCTTFGSVVATIGVKKPWWHYAINVASMTVGSWAGFHLTYHVHFDKP